SRQRVSVPRPGPRSMASLPPWSAVLYLLAQCKWPQPGEKTAESSRTPPFLLEHSTCRPRSSARQLHRSVRPLDTVARVTMSLRAFPYGLLASTRSRLTESLDAHQRAQGRDRTNVCKCHLDHLLQLPWARIQRVPPTEAARLQIIYPILVVCGATRRFQGFLKAGIGAAFADNLEHRGITLAAVPRRRAAARSGEQERSRSG